MLGRMIMRTCAHTRETRSFAIFLPFLLEYYFYCACCAYVHIIQQFYKSRTWLLLRVYMISHTWCHCWHETALVLRTNQSMFLSPVCHAEGGCGMFWLWMWLLKRLQSFWSFDMLLQGLCTPGGRSGCSIPVEKCMHVTFRKCAPSSCPFKKMFSSHDQLLPRNWSKLMFFLLCSDWLINPTVLPSMGSVIPSVPSRFAVQI